MNAVKENRKICKCYHVHENDIKKVVREHNSVDFEVLQENTFCCKGCGTCKEEINEYLNKLSSQI